MANPSAPNAGCPKISAHVAKRSRLRQEDPPDAGDILVDGVEAPKMTFKDTLLSSSNGAMPTSGFEEDDPFVIGDDDVTREFDEIEPKNEL
ncbi:hypothetical protein AAHA92_00653 [Salvia divinorum]|uniref:Uncharacterized protein n=1 Tax=Salvia divinorum TaxID=28513 RepID=A0ABD1IPL1_SALDI